MDKLRALAFSSATLFTSLLPAAGQAEVALCNNSGETLNVEWVAPSNSCPTGLHGDDDVLGQGDCTVVYEGAGMNKQILYTAVGRTTGRRWTGPVTFAAPMWHEWPEPLFGDRCEPSTFQDCGPEGDQPCRSLMRRSMVSVIARKVDHPFFIQ